MKRLLSVGEKDFIRSILFQLKNKDILLPNLDSIYVTDMDDEGMGGLTFLPKEQYVRNFGRILLSIKFIDLDNVPVVATLNLDSKSNFYELEIWKTDFSSLCHALDSTYKIVEILA